jgi:hypothetical protein
MHILVMALEVGLSSKCKIRIRGAGETGELSGERYLANGRVIGRGRRARDGAATSASI